MSLSTAYAWTGVPKKVAFLLLTWVNKRGTRALRSRCGLVPKSSAQGPPLVYAACRHA